MPAHMQEWGAPPNKKSLFFDSSNHTQAQLRGRVGGPANKKQVFFVPANHTELSPENGGGGFSAYKKPVCFGQTPKLLSTLNEINNDFSKIGDFEINNDSEKSNNPKILKSKHLIETILKQRANIAFNVAYIDPTVRVSKLKRRTVDAGIVKLDRLAEAAQRDLIEKENLFFAENQK
jgi:hypothetical protein